MAVDKLKNGVAPKRAKREQKSKEKWEWAKKGGLEPPPFVEGGEKRVCAGGKEHRIGKVSEGKIQQTSKCRKMQSRIKIGDVG